MNATLFLSEITMLKMFYYDKISFKYKAMRWHYNIKLWTCLIYVSSKGKTYSRDTRQSIIQSSHWVMGDLCGSCGRAGGVHNQIFNRRWAAKCQKLVPDPPPSRRRLSPSGRRLGEPKIRQALPSAQRATSVGKQIWELASPLTHPPRSASIWFPIRAFDI